MVSREIRYFVSSIANFLISIFFGLLYYRVSQIEPIYAIGLLIIAISFGIKGFADFIYSKYPKQKVREVFHKYTSLHYLLVGAVLLLYTYFGYIYSYFFAILSLLFAYFEYLHVRQLEDEIYRFRRHLMATVFRWFVGSFIFFDSLFYNVIKPTVFGWIITIFGTLAGIYILYSSLITYKYITSTSKVTLKEALSLS